MGFTATTISQCSFITQGTQCLVVSVFIQGGYTMCACKLMFVCVGLYHMWCVSAPTDLRLQCLRAIRDISRGKKTTQVVSLAALQWMSTPTTGVPPNGSTMLCFVELDEISNVILSSQPFKDLFKLKIKYWIWKYLKKKKRLCQPQIVTFVWRISWWFSNGLKSGVYTPNDAFFIDCNFLKILGKKLWISL